MYNYQSQEDADEVKEQMNKDLLDWNQKSSDDGLILTDKQETKSNEHRQIQALTESAPNSLMTMTADFDQDPNHVTPGGTKSNESFASDKKERAAERAPGHVLGDQTYHPLMVPEESFKKKKYRAIPMMKSDE